MTWDENWGYRVPHFRNLPIWSTPQFGATLRPHQISHVSHRNSQVARDCGGDLCHFWSKWVVEVDWLVVWNCLENGLFSIIIYGTILPIDFHIFQDGWSHQPVDLPLLVSFCKKHGKHRVSQALIQVRFWETNICEMGYPMMKKHCQLEFYVWWYPYREKYMPADGRMDGWIDK